MATYAQPAPAARAFPQQFFEFLKAEMAPPPGAYSVLTRMIIAIVISFLIVATFRMPYAAITLYSVLTIDRSSHRAAILRACESIAAVSLGVVLGLIGVILFSELPLLTFAYYALELFIVAFLIRTTRLQGPAMNMSMAIYSVHNVWERPYPATPHLEQTLWVWLTLCLGFVISVAVELALSRDEPSARIRTGLSNRLRALSTFFSAFGEQSPATDSPFQAVLSYAYAGTSSIRHLVLLLRTTDPSLQPQLLALNNVTALVARLIDVSATIETSVVLSEEDRRRLSALAAEIERLGDALATSGSVQDAGYRPLAELSDAIPALPELERTAALISSSFAATGLPENEPATPALETGEDRKIFLPDAFTNPGYLLFALKTMLAAMLCYVVYSALDWPGLSTSVVTCLVTALNTVGATTQKQILRLTGATAGGLLALGSLIFVLPETDSIASVTILVAAVSTFSAWFAVTSPRLSYFGLQTALAFYLALLQDYRATAELAPARDRALGVLLGLAMMWIVFDNLWPVSAAEHMRTGLARNVRMMAELVTALDQRDRAAAIQIIRDLRDRIQQGFAAVHGHADSVLFEVGSPKRRQDLKLRDAILRFQATLRTLLIVELAICQYRTQVVPGTRPSDIRDAQNEFDRALSGRLQQLADAVEAQQPPPGEPDLNAALEQFHNATAPWVQNLSDRWVQTRTAGIGALSRQAVSLANMLTEYCAWC